MTQFILLRSLLTNTLRKHVVIRNTKIRLHLFTQSNHLKVIHWMNIILLSPLVNTTRQTLNRKSRRILLLNIIWKRRIITLRTWLRLTHLIVNKIPLFIVRQKTTRPPLLQCKQKGNRKTNNNILPKTATVEILATTWSGSMVAPKCTFNPNVYFTEALLLELS